MSQGLLLILWEKFHNCAWKCALCHSTILTYIDLKKIISKIYIQKENNYIPFSCTDWHGSMWPLIISLHIKTHGMSCGPRSRRATREYINREKVNAIFTPLYLGDPLSDWNQSCYRRAGQLGESTFQIWRNPLQPFPRYELPKFQLFFFVSFLLFLLRVFAHLQKLL